MIKRKSIHGDIHELDKVILKTDRNDPDLKDLVYLRKYLAYELLVRIKKRQVERIQRRSVVVRRRYRAWVESIW